MWLEQMRRSYVHLDPGLLRCRHGLRCIFAVFLSLIITLAAPAEMHLFAGFSAACFAQARIGQTYKEQHILFITAGCIAVALVYLGNTLQHEPLLSNLVFLTISFLVFYVRRFGGRFFLIPVMVMVIYFLSMLFPGGGVQTEENMLGAAVGILSAYLVHFFFFPVNHRADFFQRVFVLFQDAFDFVRHLEVALAAEKVGRLPAQLDDFIEQCRFSYQYNLKLSNDYFQSREINDIAQLLELHYATTKSFAMLGESLYQWLRSPARSRVLVLYYRERLIQLMLILERVEKEKNGFSFPNALIEKLKELLQERDKVLDHCDLKPGNATHIYNLDVSLERLCGYLSAWNAQARSQKR